MDTTHTTGGWLRAALRPLTTARGGTTLVHHLLGLPLGILYFTWFVTAFAAGLGLAITLIGLPILTLVLASVRPLLRAERGLAGALLGADVPAPLAPLAPAGGGTLLARAAAYWKDRSTWRGLAYLLLRSVTGPAAFVVATAAFGTAATMIAAPVVAPLDSDTWNVAAWEIDTLAEALPLLPLGLLALVASGWISEGLGQASRALARWAMR